MPRHEDDAENYFDPATEKLWQQNAVLCQNFDELKRLYLQSTQINLQLQTTCSALQQEKEDLQKEFCEQSRKFLKIPEHVTADDSVTEERPKPKPETSRLVNKDAVIFDLEQAIQQLE